MIIDDCEIIVDYNRQQLMPGWIPRRLGQLKRLILVVAIIFIEPESSDYFFVISPQVVVLVVIRSRDNFVLGEEKNHFVHPCMHLFLCVIL